jgi:transcriptional regulator with XRE-family HTH domain
MEKQLNFKRIELAMERIGLNKAQLAKKLDVSRAIVTAWFKNEKFPRPDKLLKIGLALRLPFENLVIKDDLEPIIAFRKKSTRKTKEEHIDRAKDMGRLLERLVPFLSPKRLTAEPVLKNPNINFRYIQDVASMIREQMGANETGEIDFKQLINRFHDFEVVIIPVLWGSKKNHENALHIHLPKSKTTWTFLNLDSNLHDFKFWMAHELGHILAPSLKGDDGEDFADIFAQALLFPEKSSKTAYAEIKALSGISKRLEFIFSLANKLMISPITIRMAVDTYAQEHDLPPVNLGKKFYGAVTNFNKEHRTFSKIINYDKEYSPADYINTAKKEFNSPFFEVLKRYLSEKKQSPGFIQNLLQITLVDAKEVHAELVS